MHIAQDSHELDTSLYTERTAIDKSAQADVNVIRYEYETCNVEHIIWIPGKVNLIDFGSMPGSFLTLPMVGTMENGFIATDLTGN